MADPSEIISFIIFSSISAAASFSDIKHLRIPDILTISGTISLLSVKLAITVENPFNTACGILSAVILFMTVRLLTGGKLGMGDVKFSALMGIFLGFPGWFTAAAAASAAGLVFALAGIVSGKMHRDSKIPFAPFLTAGSIAAFFLNPWLFRIIAEHAK